MSANNEKCPKCGTWVYGDIPTGDKAKSFLKDFISGFAGGFVSERYGDERLGKVAANAANSLLSSSHKQLYDFCCPKCGYSWRSCCDGSSIQPMVDSSVTIEEIWQDHYVDNDGVMGLNIHIKFQADWLRDVECVAIAYFSFEDGDDLKDFNNSYRTPDGHVCALECFTPSYDSSLFEDITIFMPYKELHVNEPSDLSFCINMWDDEGNCLCESDYYSFSYNPKTISEEDAIVCYKKGLAYYYGNDGVEINYQEAAKWFRKAAEQGNSDAQFFLGTMYDDGKGVNQNYTEAAKWFRKAAEQGDAFAQYVLGDFYYHGEGVIQDYSEAVKWYMKSAEQGNEGAQCNLGDCFENGNGVTQNYQEAIKWYTKSAEQGCASAQCSLGKLYYYGNGVSQNNNEALKCFRKAAEQGDEEAIQKLKEMGENV